MNARLVVIGRRVIELALVLGFGAILRYPGGDPLERGSIGYSATRNFLSDLGMTVAYDGHPNLLGAGLFAASLLLLIVGAASILSHTGRELSNTQRSRLLVRLAGLTVASSCVCFAAVAFTPENRVMGMHVRVTLLAWRLVPVGTALFAVAAFSARDVSRATKITLIALTLAMTAYVGVLGWGPSTRTLEGLRFDVIAQKAATLVLLGGILALASTRYGVRAALQRTDGVRR